MFHVSEKINFIVHVVHSENIPRADSAMEVQLHYQTPVTQISVIVCGIDNLQLLKTRTVTLQFTIGRFGNHVG
jgi:hypothetical protein